MNRTASLVCIHAGPAYANLTILGLFFVAGWFPPLSPALNATEMTQLYVDDRTRVRFGVCDPALLQRVFHANMRGGIYTFEKG